MWFFIQIAALLLVLIISIRYVLKPRDKPRKRQKGDAVFVTGCDTGFGNLLVKKLDKLDYCVFAACLTEDGASELKEDTSDNVHTIQCDVTKQDDIDRAYDTVCDVCKEKKWRLVSLVNNAGTLQGFIFDLTPISIFDRVFSVNFFGLVKVTKTFLPLIKKTRGRLVFVTSSGGFQPLPFFSAYIPSKYAAEGFCGLLRRELKHFGIKVCIINPGGAKTPLTDRTLDNSLRAYDEGDPAIKQQYGDVFMDEIKVLFDPSGDRTGAPSVVADAMVHAVTSENPKTRYVVGIDAHIFRALSLLPDEYNDYLLNFIFPVPKPASER